MRYENCKLIDDDGTVLHADLTIEMHIRDPKSARRDRLSLWHGTIRDTNDATCFPAFAGLMIPKTFGGLIVIDRFQETNGHVRFEGVSDAPVLRNRNANSQLSTKCDECGSNFLTEVSMMCGLCPECAHYLHGYPNCFHEFEGGECILCKWDGATSDYIERLKRKR